MALDTVGDYLDRSRVLLQDRVEPFRYEDDELIAALNMAVLEARRLRPDLFLRTFDDLPEYTATGDAVEIDQQLRVAFVYYICGHAQLRDDEGEQDARASGFLNKFVAQMLTIQA